MKIGITLNMSVALWANGMQQNIVFLYEILQECGHDCLYITAEKPRYGVNKKHRAIILSDLMSDPNEKLDMLIVAGFDLPKEIISNLKKRNPKLKVILIHYGNKLFDDIHYGICSENIPQKEPINTPYKVDCIWTSPHYSFALKYLEVYHNCEVKIAPYIWDPMFLKVKIQELEDKKTSPIFTKNEDLSICIFEPNKNSTKTSLIPIMVCEKFNQLFPEEIKSINAFCCSKLRKRDYFIKYINRLSLNQKKDFIFFNNRWAQTEAISKFGKYIISHQTYNELNYSHLECLYMGCPLIHNSEELQDYGYYYPEFDIEMAAKQLKNAKINHALTLKQYKEDAKEAFHKFSIYNKENIKLYKDLIDG